MPVCASVVVPQEGRREDATGHLARIEGSEVGRAENEVLPPALTSTVDGDENAESRLKLPAAHGVQAVFLSYGETDSHIPRGNSTREGTR